MFLQVLGLACAIGMLKLGTVALDGTKIHANASRHSALSYENASRIERQLKAKVADLMTRHEAVDQADLPDGTSVPKEMARRETRLAAIAKANVKLEARAMAQSLGAHVGYDTKLTWQNAKRAAGKKSGENPLVVSMARPPPTDQVNLTEDDSRIMPVASGGYEQCPNTQAAVAAGSLLVVATYVVQAPNDKEQLEPMLDKIAALPDELGDKDALLADNGYFSVGKMTLAALLTEASGPLGRRDYAAPRTLSGVALVTKHSGKTCIVVMRQAVESRLRQAMCQWRLHSPQIGRLKTPHFGVSARP